MERTKMKLGLLWRTILKVGQEYPRRVMHSFKVGFALSLVSLLYLMEPLFKGNGQNAIWAVITVVVVLEFNAGATLCKGVNRGFGTLVAGTLAFLIEFITNEFGTVAHAIFITAAVSLIACVDEYFNDQSDSSQATDEHSDEDPIHSAVMDSKHMDEMLALYANWEPHAWLCYRSPWKQYVKLGDVLRHFGYYVVVLQGCLQTEIQTSRSVRVMFKDPCIRLAEEVSRVLMELANSIRHRQHCLPEILSDHLHQALHDLDTALKLHPKLFLGSKNAKIFSSSVAAFDQEQGNIGSKGHRAALHLFSI